MKQLVLIRHAKSDWDAGIFSDHERTLNAKGHSQAQEVAQQLFKTNIYLDSFISSTAVRAFTTATYFTEAYQLPSTQIIKESSLYNAPLETYYSLIPTIDDAFNSVALFAHNPGITQIANSLTSYKIIDMPTAGVFICKAHVSNWKDFLKSTKEFVKFIQP